MKRSPIVLTATAAGTAGVLAFQPHTPAVRTATARVATPAVTASATAAAARRTAIGDAVDTQYGPVQVKVTVRDGKIVAVQALQLPSSDPKSQSISAYAAPILQQEFLSAQSANVSAVSGASFTSAGFLQSAQSALAKLGMKA